ncbi:MAG: phage BR0599 family protein, partial [Phycisphaerales bacterium]
ENVKVTIKRIRWNAIYAADEEITVFVGLGNVRFDRKVLNLTCRPMINSLNIQVPRHAYQEPYNYAVFEPGCTLTQSNYAYNGTSTGGSKTSLQDTTRGTCYKVAFDGGDEDNPVERADTITGQQNGGTATVVQITYLTAGTGYLWYVALSGTQFGDNEPLQNGDADAVICNGTPAADDTFYQLGEIKITSGPNNGQRRQIHSDSGGLTIPTWGFPVGLEVGMTYSIYPGCDGLAITCRDKFDNKIPYRGFPYIRRPEETIWR